MVIYLIQGHVRRAMYGRRELEPRHLHSCGDVVLESGKRALNGSLRVDGVNGSAVNLPD